MEMRACGSARSAAQADYLPAFYPIPFLYFELGEMQIKSEQTLAVIEYDEVAFEIEWACQQHGAVIHGSDGCSARNAEIQAQVRA